MELRPNFLTNILLVLVALLLVIGLKFWGITGERLSEKAEFSGLAAKPEQCFVGIIDPERSQANLAAKSFTCASHFVFVYSHLDTYTSPLVNGRGFKISVPAGWAVIEKTSVADDWVVFSKFSSDNSGSYSFNGTKATVSVGPGSDWLTSPAADPIFSTLEKIGK